MVDTRQGLWYSRGVAAKSKKYTRLRTLWSWLQPGLGIKRWIALLIVGIFLTALGISIGAAALSGEPGFNEVTSPPAGVMVGGLVFAGVAASLLALFRLNRSLLSPYVKPGKPVVEVVAQHRRLGRGPKIVAIGGGTGLATLLRGLKTHTRNLTAIVTMADDGGSSGRLRRSLGLPPPGDLRSCLAALSDDEDLLTQLFQYRFLKGEELEGHSFGNLFIAALSGVTGSFDRGILEAGRVLAIRGRVLPSTLADVSLAADKTPTLEFRAIRVEGESRIPDVPGQIRRVYIEPSDPPAYPEAIHALLNADMIVIGPGSLYTSVLPNLLVPDIADAVRSSRAFRVYVCNVATQKGETDDYDCEAHWSALAQHAGDGLVDVVVANDCLDMALPEGVSLVAPPAEGLRDVPFYSTDIIDHDGPWRHKSDQLAERLISLLEERTGPLEWPKVDQVERVSELN
ncbi:MAG: YvcK family protein [Anaerolineae bacterium]|nr:MAG: YvcK family protein [Anaerolineae bacterium]